MRKRTRITALAAALMTAGAGAFAAIAPAAQGIAFDVLREGSTIGSHEVRFRQEDDLLHVNVDIALDVKFAFLTLFRYRHQNHEVWRDGRLISLDTTTDDDGRDYWVRARATEAGLAVESSTGDYLAPAGIIPTSYWNPRTVAQTRLLDTQKGRLLAVEIAPAGTDDLSLAGQRQGARKYDVSGDIDLMIWYSESGEWAKIAFEARGAEIEYTRRPKGSGAERQSAKLSGQS